MTIPQTYSQMKEYYQNGGAASDLALAMLKMIGEKDSVPGGTNSVAIVNPDLLFLADEADRRLKAGDDRILAGMPVIIKANIDTKDQMPTTGGSAALKNNYAVRDSFVAKKLRESGAIIMGKANMSEFANFMSYNMPSGYSSLGGQVLNPNNASYPPGGSSSGVAAAVAEGLAGLGVGTETNGSIIWPAQMCGAAGLKPSMGLISRTGIMPICSTLDTAGPICKTVTGAAAVMNAIAGYDPEDPATFGLKDKEPEDFMRYLDKDFLRGKRIGLYAVSPEMISEDQAKANEAIIDAIKRLGAEPVEGVALEEETHVQATEMFEFKNCLNHYLASEFTTGMTLEKILKYNIEHSETALKYGQKRIEDAQNASGRMTEPEYIESLMAREQVIEKINGIMDGMNLDAILCLKGITNLAPFTGFPAMTIPVVRTEENVPVGCCIMARHMDDARLLGMMYSLEQELQFK